MPSGAWSSREALVRLADDDMILDMAIDELAALRDEAARLRPHAAAWARLCAIDKERQSTHRRPMLPRGVMDEVNAIATGKGG